MALWTRKTKWLPRAARDLRITGEAFEIFFFFLRIGGEGKELSVCACVYSRITLCVHVCVPACGLVVLLLLSETPRPVLPFFFGTFRCLGHFLRAMSYSAGQGWSRSMS